MMVTGSHGVRMQYDYTGDIGGLPGAVSPTSPRWLRLTRAGDTITGYDSADGKHWRLVGTVHLAGLPTTVQAGMFAATPPYNKVTKSFLGASDQGGPALATASFDDASLRGSWPAKVWTGSSVGASRLAPGTGGGNFAQADGAYTVSGSGDIAPLVLGPQSSIPSTTIEQPLVGRVHRPHRGDRRSGNVRHWRVPARPDSRHPGRDPATGAGAGREGSRGRRDRIRRGAGCRRYSRYGSACRRSALRGSTCCLSARLPRFG